MFEQNNKSRQTVYLMIKNRTLVGEVWMVRTLMLPKEVNVKKSDAM